MKTLLLKLLGFDVREPSLIHLSIDRFTNSSWLDDVMDQGRLFNYQYVLYTNLYEE